jgi:hypothetical protein
MFINRLIQTRIKKQIRLNTSKVEQTSINPGDVYIYMILSGGFGGMIYGLHDNYHKNPRLKNGDLIERSISASIDIIPCIVFGVLYMAAFPLTIPATIVEFASSVRSK